MRGVTPPGLDHASSAPALRVRPASRYLRIPTLFWRRLRMQDKNKRLRGRLYRAPFCALGLAAALSACQPAGTRPDPVPAAVDAAGAEDLATVEVPYVPLLDPIVEQSDLLARLRSGFTWPEERARPAVARELE